MVAFMGQGTDAAEQRTLYTSCSEQVGAGAVARAAAGEPAAAAAPPTGLSSSASLGGSEAARGTSVADSCNAVMKRLAPACACACACACGIGFG